MYVVHAFSMEVVQQTIYTSPQQYPEWKQNFSTHVKLAVLDSV